MYPFVFQPNLHQVVWGGNRLAPWKGLELDSPENIGESWEVSAVDSSPSVIANGEYDGMLLTDVIRRKNHKTEIKKTGGFYKCFKKSFIILKNIIRPDIAII